MTFLARLLLIAAALLPAVAAASSASPAGPAPVAAAALRISGPTLIAVRPPAASMAGQEGADEALAHLEFALADTRRCLGAKRVRFENVEGERVTISDRRGTQTVDFGIVDDGIGAVLAEPGRPLVVVRPTVGSSSLAHLLPQAAYAYWRVRACRRD